MGGRHARKPRERRFTIAPGKIRLPQRECRLWPVRFQPSRFPQFAQLAASRSDPIPTYGPRACKLAAPQPTISESSALPTLHKANRAADSFHRSRTEIPERFLARWARLLDEQRPAVVRQRQFRNQASRQPDTPSLWRFFSFREL